MEYPILTDADRKDGDITPESDVRAMLSMIDYLIARIGPIDQTSANCLLMARKTLATFTAHPRLQ